MAKNTAITVKLKEDFATKKAGDTMLLSKEIAVSVVNRGIADYCTEEAASADEPIKETKVKKSQKHKK